MDATRTFAAIDIGSNSCRLKIARAQQHRLKDVHEDREVTRLGESVFDSGMVSPDAMANTLRALKRFNKAIQSFAVDRLRAVATAALRDARNGMAFVAWVKSETGWDLEIISGLEEARLIHRGVMREPETNGRCLLIDLGGGSCEVTLSEQKRILETVSLPLGAVRLTQEFLRENDPPTADEIDRLRQFTERHIARVTQKISGEGIEQVIATSGTALALALASNAPSPAKGKIPAKLPRDAKPGFAEAKAVRRVADRLLKMSVAERTRMPGIGPRRAEIIAAGAQVYAELLDRLKLPGFRYSDMGLRDGILAQMFAEEDERTTAHQQIERDRRESVWGACRRYGVDPEQAEPVRCHARQLFRDLQPMHALPPEYREWLEAAAMLRDIGKYINYQGHHRHTQYIIASSEMNGFTPQQRAVVSAIARYLGKSRPDLQDRAYRAIPLEEHASVQRAIVLLRLAVALNQDRVSEPLKVSVRLYPKRVLLELHPGRTGAELELWTLRKEAAYFREVFRRDLLATLA